MYDVVVQKVHVRYLISWWVSCNFLVSWNARNNVLYMAAILDVHVCRSGISSRAGKRRWTSTLIPRSLSMQHRCVSVHHYWAWGRDTDNAQSNNKTKTGLAYTLKGYKNRTTTWIWALLCTWLSGRWNCDCTTRILYDSHVRVACLLTGLFGLYDHTARRQWRH